MEAWGSLEQIGMADKWKLSPKRVVVVWQQGRRMVCEGGGASAQNERILLVPLRGGGADPEESQRLRLLEGSGGEPFGGE